MTPGARPVQEFRLTDNLFCQLAACFSLRIQGINSGFVRNGYPKEDPE